MKPSEALHAHRADIRRVIKQSRMRNPRVFGSVLHGEDNSNSDLDLLVDWQRRISYTVRGIYCFHSTEHPACLNSLF